MDSVEVVLLTGLGPPVLKMPDRKFPGVLLQGDTLSMMVSDARDLASELAEAQSDAAEDAALLADALGNLLDHYAETLREHGIALPYAH